MQGTFPHISLWFFFSSPLLLALESIIKYANVVNLPHGGISLQTNHKVHVIINAIKKNLKHVLNAWVNMKRSMQNLINKT